MKGWDSSLFLLSFWINEKGVDHVSQRCQGGICNTEKDVTKQLILVQPVEADHGYAMTEYSERTLPIKG